MGGKMLDRNYEKESLGLYEVVIALRRNHINSPLRVTVGQGSKRIGIGFHLEDVEEYDVGPYDLVFTTNPEYNEDEQRIVSILGYLEESLAKIPEELKESAKIWFISRNSKFWIHRISVREGVVTLRTSRISPVASWRSRVKPIPISEKEAPRFMPTPNDEKVHIAGEYTIDVLANMDSYMVPVLQHMPLMYRDPEQRKQLI